MIEVNGTQISEDAILAEMQYHPAESQRAAMIKAAESMIISELLKQRAQNVGLKVDEENATDEDFVEQLIDKEVAMPEVKEEECLQYYSANKEKFCSAPLLAARHILIEADPEDLLARDQAKQKADLILDRLKHNVELFEEMASEYSACPSAKTGGQLGQIGPGQTVPEFERQLFACEQGLVGAPIESRYGYHVVMIDMKVDGEQLPFEAVQKKIAEYLSEKVERKAIAQYIETLIADAEIDGFDFSVSSSPLMQ